MSWHVTVFDAVTEVLVVTVPVPDVTVAAVRQEWQLPAGEPVGELLITDAELPFISSRLGVALELQPGQVAFLGTAQDHRGEVVVEPNGTHWYPPP